MLESFGRYRVESLLARGGMGEVYLGWIDGDFGFRKRVVIKLIRKEYLDNERFAMMFIDEARIAAGLHHRNIVRTFDFDRVDAGLFLVTEFVNGCDLRILTRRAATLDYQTAIAIIVELAAGLAAAHTATDAEGVPLDLVHRDVSPSNVLLGLHGEVKLADFGVAKARTRLYHTVSGSIKGKVAYMAPEQILGGELDRRADVFALGVLLFEVTTGTKLYSGFSSMAAMDRILEGHVPDPVERRADYPTELATIVRRALASERDARYVDANALIEDLDELSRANGWTRSLASVGSAVRIAVADRTPEPSP